MQFLRARLSGQPLPEITPAAQAAASAPPDAEHAGAGRIEPDARQAAAIMDEALPGGSANPLPGGLAQPQPLWLVECGNFTSRSLPFPGLRALTHLQALALMGCNAAVPGSAELQLTGAQALEFMQDSPVPLVSCNLQLKLPGASVAQFVKLSPGWYVTGVSSWKPAPGEPPAERWWELKDAVESARGVLEQLPRGAQLIVIAPHQPEAVYQALAQLPLALLVGSEVRLAGAGAPMLSPPAGKAELLRLATLDAGADGVQLAPWQFELSDYWPDDPQVGPLFKQEYKTIRERVLGVRAGAGGKNAWKKVEWGQSDTYLPGGGKAGSVAGTSAQSAVAAAAGARQAPLYVGATSCMPCHSTIYYDWVKSRHARALMSLKAEEERQNLDCLKCHTTGLLQSGGYDPFTEWAGNGMVDCEACHGPGAAHVALMSGGNAAPAGAAAGAAAGSDAAGNAGDAGGAAASAGPLRIRRGSLSDCVTCHDSYNSPKFDAQAYWAKVKH